jgi:uncharacterized protein involved in response to NO
MKEFVVVPIALEELRREPSRGAALFALGFRPFFLAAGLAAVALVGLWVMDYGAIATIPTYFGRLNWHAHEMVFGYAVAVIAGFLLTAVRNWTGVPTARGQALAALVVLWLAGRVAPFVPHLLPPAIIATLDLAFVPVLGVSLAVPLLRQRQLRNVPFLPILGVLFAANAMVHFEALGLTTARAQRGLHLGIDVIVLLIAVIGGRVIPFFTERALPGARPRTWRPVEVAAVGSVVLIAALGILEADARLTIAAGLTATVAHSLRLWGWSDRRLWSVPLLWILYLGYGWVVAGFLLEALAAMRLVPPAAALHAYTAGGIGALTLGMMSRVALGHTGRKLVASRPVIAAFVLVNLAAAGRVVAGLAAPDAWYVAAIGGAGFVWVLAFAFFVGVYAPILLRPRTDGLPG